METRTAVDVGSRIRSARQQQQLSLSAVAERSNISTATLSRIETSKQSVDVDLLVTLAGILGVPPAQLLGDGGGDQELDALAGRLAALTTQDRAKLMHAASRRRRTADLATLIDDLMLTLDVVRDELEEVGRATRKRRKR